MRVSETVCESDGPVLMLPLGSARCGSIWEVPHSVTVQVMIYCVDFFKS